MSPVHVKDLTLYHFPGCPFSERVEILLHLKGIEAVTEVIIDISAPRPDWLLAKTGGATALPALQTPHGTLLESAAILRFIDTALPGRKLANADPYRHAVEEMLAGLGPSVSAAGYKMIQNRDQASRAILVKEVDAAFGRLDAFIMRHSTSDVFLYDDFGWAEIMLTPMMKRLWFLEYYDNYQIPQTLERLCAWRNACLSHPATQARSFEEIVKLYHDYSRGFGSGRLPDGRTVSSFAPEPHWSTRPMPPRDKWATAPDDAALGLVPL